MPTLVPWPCAGVTGLGEYESGVTPVSVPLVSGFCASPTSPTVVSETWPAKDWLRPTLKLPTLLVVPVVGSVIADGEFIVKSGMDWVSPE